jgi:hypothetical protein
MMSRLEECIMGFRLRKSIKLFPGVRINLSKSGVSTSIGGRGATINISKRGTRGTVGIPGTGISYSERLSRPKAARAVSAPREGMNFGALLVWALLAFFAILTVSWFK